MLLRIILVTALIAVAMAAVKDRRVLSSTGLVGTCTGVASPAGDTGVWQACRAGKLEGRPNLTRKSCVSRGVSRGFEYWRCPAPVGSGSAPLAVASSG